MIVIGVTGTKGKTTTCNLIAQILNLCGYKTGMATTVNFRIGEKVWANETKQTMLGRFQLQKLLAQMAKKGCKYAVVETSSEGILQHRHRGINYNIAVFTNLTPEHIERHGSFEKYRDAKLELFKKVSRKESGVGIYNLDDTHAEYFLAMPIGQQYGFCLNCQILSYRGAMMEKKYKISNIKLFPNKTKFSLLSSTGSASSPQTSSGQTASEEFEMPIIGEFNVFNAVAAICVALSQGISFEKIKRALGQAKTVPGRMEIIDEGQDFTAVVDYSYEPASFENALKNLQIFKPKRIIALIGSAGGGRDKWRRPVMGELADKYADIIIITTDDPYDEKPKDITDQILEGVLKNPKRNMKKNVFEIVDRHKAIKKAIEIAKAGDTVLFAGKGGERWMNVAKGKKIPWHESEIVKEEIKKKLNY